MYWQHGAAGGLAGRQKSPGRCRGSVCRRVKVKSVVGRAGSAVAAAAVAATAEAAKAVIQANQPHIDVLADVFRLGENWSGQTDVARAHEQMIVLDTDRPVRSKAKFQTRTDRAT